MAVTTLHTDLGEENADLTSHDAFVRAVPHATFARMRREQPVAWVEEADGEGFWALTKHADVSMVSRDFGRFTASRGIRIEQMAPDELEARRTMMEFDPPEHARLRRLVQPGFTPKVVATYEAAFRILAGQVLDQVLPLGNFDFVTEISRELPIRLLCRLLGVPETDAGKLVSWGDQMISNADPEYTPVVIDKVDTEEYRLLPFRAPAALEVFRYAEEVAIERRNHPEDDIITVLLTAEPDGQPLTDLEFKNFFTLLMVAGNETTRHTISHGLTYLVDHPDQMEQLRDDPDGLSVSATEEILRASAVTMHFRRTATEEVEIRGTRISAGDRVVMWYPSANYDEEVFDEPLRFDIRRQPNDHLTFGTGRHVCLGASLARLEVRVVFEELLKRVAAVEIVGAPDRLRSNFINGVKHLPVHVALA
ncbi:MAG TPA: cytochrome P450 [Acidimicrobiia bacterium]|nr:cytochrome P450 [Acidimicrobiia bacterium]